MKSNDLTSSFFCDILKIGDSMKIVKFPDNGYYERILALVFEKLLAKDE